MKTTVYKNASIVTGLSVAERCLGFLYRIVLSRYVGAEGLGLYQVALSLFSLFMTIGTGGIPITVSRMISKCKAEGDSQGEKATLSAGIFVSLLTAMPLCLLLWLFGDKMTFLFSDSRTFPVLKILLIGVAFACVYAVIRGYFWGNKRFFTASLLEMTEEIVMVIVGIFLLRRIPTPLVGAKRAAWAATLSYLFSSMAAVVCFFCLKGKLGKPKKMLKPLFNASMPITLVRASGSLVTSLVAVLLPAMLIKAGLSEGEALKLFGILSGMVLPVLFIPSTLIGSLSLVLVPELSEDYYKKQTERLRKNIGRGLRFAFLVACTLIPFFFVLGEEVGRLAFSSPTAGKIISKSCVILLPMSLTMISTSTLNSIGFEKQTFLFFFLGAAVLLLCVLFLPPVCGAYAYIVGLGASYTVTAVCNLVFLHTKCPIFENRWTQVCVQLLFPVIICILPLSLLGKCLLSLFHRFLGEWLCVIATVLSLALATLLLYLLIGVLSIPLSPKQKNGKRAKKRPFYAKSP